jgi:glycerophosphoryl diester phosphodiesterase
LIVLILGHRGASSAHPENTLEAFAAAYEGGAKGLEFDVRGDINNVPVLSHDRSLERRAGDPRNVDELPLAELKTLDVGQGSRIPTLSEALLLIGGRGFIDIEIKQAGIEREVLEAMAGYRGAWGISCFDWSCLETFRSLDREVKLWLLATNFSDSLFSTALKLNAVGVAMHHAQINESSMKQTSEAGLSVIAWTVNDAAEAQRLADLGCYALCTDIPELLYMIS